MLIAIHPYQEQEHIILIQRVEKGSDRHSGQISFPGGKFEESDETLESCAIREAQEEVGLNTAGMKIQGALTPLYIPVSNFEVFPFVALVESQDQLVPQESEVAQIHRISLDSLLQDDVIGQRDHEVRPGLILPQVLHFDIDGLFIWGATAMILNELRWVLKGR